jgi:hypothetical protein
MAYKKKEADNAFDRYQLDESDLSEIDRIRNMLDPTEVVRVVARQSKVMPGGKLVTPKIIFATNKRLIIRDPTMLGLRSDVDTIPYSQINNVKLEKGLFTSRILIKSGNFNRDEQGYIDAIPKEKAAKIVGIINEGICRAQTHVTEIAQPICDDSDISQKGEEPLLILKRRLAKGEITTEEYEDLKKTLE